MTARLTLLLLVLLASPAAAAPRSTEALARGLARGGRAEATLRWSVPGPPGSPEAALRGALALEPPDLARLDVAGTGEVITLRSDGGEWLQPALHQFVRLTPRHSVAAMRWWRLLAGAGGAQERRIASRRYRLLIPGTPYAAADSADVWLDAAGLPERLELSDGMGGVQSFRVSRWRFVARRGAAAFRLQPPPGVETVEMP